MSDLELIDAVAQVTGEDTHEIRRRGFTLLGPSLEQLADEHDCDITLVELPLPGTVDWDSILSDDSERPYSRPIPKAKKRPRKVA